MKLAAWRKREGKSQEWLADRLSCSQSFISQIERSRDPLVPGRDIMRQIYILTHRAVPPTEFYNIEAWEADLIRREGDAELARKAA